MSVETARGGDEARERERRRESKIKALIYLLTCLFISSFAATSSWGGDVVAVPPGMGSRFVSVDA